MQESETVVILQAVAMLPSCPKLVQLFDLDLGWVTVNQDGLGFKSEFAQMPDNAYLTPVGEADADPVSAHVNNTVSTPRSDEREKNA